MLYRFHPWLRPLIWGTETWLLPPDEIADDFPLLIKFIDPQLDLSIQVHPNDEVAVRHGLPHGKTEMWYVTRVDEGGHLYCGWSKSLSPEQFREKTADGSIVEAMARYDVQPGDCFFIPGGRIHALSGGCHVCEIQQNSDTTYRIFDYNRRDAQGNLRPLHIDKAAESLDYTVLPDYHVSLPLECDYFTTELIELSASDGARAIPAGPIVLICLEGEGQTTATDQAGETVTAALHAGEVIYLDADTRSAEISGDMRLLLARVH